MEEITSELTQCAIHLALTVSMGTYRHLHAKLALMIASPVTTAGIVFLVME